MTERLVRGIEPREDFPSLAIFEELLAEKHLLIADHTRRHLRHEIALPGPVIDRTSRARWVKEGQMSLRKRAAREVERLIAKYTPSRLPEESKRELTRLMESEARRHGMETLPARNGE
jgi:trimethylamine:corrinoid methyltransferase-like protein